MLSKDTRLTESFGIANGKLMGGPASQRLTTCHGDALPGPSEAPTSILEELTP